MDATYKENFVEEPDEEKFSRPELWTGEAGNWLLRVCELNPTGFVQLGPGLEGGLAST